MKTQSRILVVDDEAAIRKFLRVGLEAQDYQVAEAVSGQEGLAQAVSFRPDLVVLDLELPDMKGSEVLRRLREWTPIPIIVLTVRDSDEDKVALLDAGADDYLTKPFSMPELMARIRVAERHRSHHDSGTAIFRSGPLEVDLASRQIKVDGVEIHLTATEYAILRLLVEHAGKVVIHRHLLKEIWGPNAVEHTQYLRVYVGHLRKKIERGPNSPELIRTEAGVGYRLMII